MPQLTPKHRLVGLVIGALAISNTIGCSVLALESGCRKVDISESTALDIGKTKVQLFCDLEKLACGTIPSPQISSIADVPWIIDYRATSDDGKPYFVRVTIDSCGVVETSGEMR